MNTNKLSFEFDAVDKRHVQISTARLTAADILIHARMLNEYRYYNEQGKPYTPSHTMLAVVGRFAGRKPVIATLKRLEDCGLIRLDSKAIGQANTYTVFKFDEVQGLLTEPSITERRHESMPLEKRGYKTKAKELSDEVDSKTQVGESSERRGVSPEDTGEVSPEDTHERTLLKNKKELKETDDEGQNLKDLNHNGLDGRTEADKQNCLETDNKDQSTSDRECAGDEECASTHCSDIAVSNGSGVTVPGKPVLYIIVDNTKLDEPYEPKSQMTGDDEPLEAYDDEVTGYDYDDELPAYEADVAF